MPTYDSTKEPYKSDLAKLKEDKAKEYENLYQALFHINRATPEQLKHRGYKTTGEAMQGTFKYYDKILDGILKKFLKKYPD